MKYETFHFPGIDSTNTWATSNTHLFDKNQLTLVVANKQSEGRGRFKKRWQSPRDRNIYATFGVFIHRDKGVQSNLSQIMALAVIDTLEEIGIQPKIKWPNDLLVDSKKIAGILTETEMVEDHIFYAIGIGINVNMTKEELTAINQPATSAAAELGKEFACAEILESLKQHFSHYLRDFLENGFSSLLETFKEKLIHSKNQQICFNERDTRWKGKFHSLNDDGTLNLKLETGEIKRFLAGEIESAHNLLKNV